MCHHTSCQHQHKIKWKSEINTWNSNSLINKIFLTTTGGVKGSLINANHKVVVSHHLYPVMKHFYPDVSGLFQDDNVPIYTRFTRGHWMFWWVWIWYVSHALALAVTRSQPKLNTYERFWTDVLDSALHHHHQNIKRENMVLKNGVTDVHIYIYRNKKWRLCSFNFNVCIVHCLNWIFFLPEFDNKVDII